MRKISVLAGSLACTMLCGVASAQDMSYQPISPTFGGNPFNSSHILAIAGVHRPDAPKELEEETTLTDGQLFVQQLQSRLLSSLSSSLVEAITGAEPGTTGEFTVGDQSISFERTLSNITVKITDTVTGEVTTLVVPVLNLNKPPVSSLSASNSLGASDYSTSLKTSSLTQSGLDTTPLAGLE